MLKNISNSKANTFLPEYYPGTYLNRIMFSLNLLLTPGNLSEFNSADAEGPNKLGGFNRALNTPSVQEMLTGFSKEFTQGTPPPTSIIRDEFKHKYGEREFPIDLSKITYGPAAGFPFIRQKIS